MGLRQRAGEREEERVSGRFTLRKEPLISIYKVIAHYLTNAL